MSHEVGNPVAVCGNPDAVSGSLAQYLATPTRFLAPGTDGVAVSGSPAQYLATPTQLVPSLWLPGAVSGILGAVAGSLVQSLATLQQHLPSSLAGKNSGSTSEQNP